MKKRTVNNQAPVQTTFQGHGAGLTLPNVQQQLQNVIAPNGILVYATCNL